MRELRALSLFPQPRVLTTIPKTPQIIHVHGRQKRGSLRGTMLLRLLLEAIEGEVGHVPVTPSLEVHDVLGLARGYVCVIEHQPVVAFLPYPPHVVSCDDELQSMFARVSAV